MMRISEVRKQKAPARSRDRTEANWGLGVRHSLFPTLTLGAPLRGCQLPDAILHGKRNCGLIAGPSSALRRLNHRVRPLGSLRLAFADAGLRTG
jgi:hypothetical protein